MIIESWGFELDGYKIPPFTLEPSEMVRIWVPVTALNGGLTGYDMSKHLIQAFANKRGIQGLKVQQTLPFADTDPQSRLISFFYPLTVQRFLKHKCHLTDEETRNFIMERELVGEEKIEKLDATVVRSMTIRALALKSSCIVFHYFGLNPLGEEIITELVKSLIESGKSAIAFDNLHYMPESEPYSFIKRVIVERQI